ncbi:hypothetical protein [Roseobacter sp. N2S]|uniref:hypothetical protein n=1 Tax=Roseobacter sp. N2S TaxID=2663844 RepID=UPI0028572CCA|nr:hypothetical protein [Roseobacter sp. N2S]MDR6266532.1 hypothetical protein [Roseobacter sp. N2S]
MDISEILREFWAIIISAVAVIVWIVRIEAKVITNSREIRRVWLQRREDLETAERSRRETHEMLTVIQNDIKTLLFRQNGGS